jgi:hypothetical protein
MAVKAIARSLSASFADGGALATLLYTPQRPKFLLGTAGTFVMPIVCRALRQTRRTQHHSVRIVQGAVLAKKVTISCATGKSQTEQ